MTTNFGPSLKDTQEESPTPTNLSAVTGREKSGETCNATEVQQGENQKTVLFDRQSNWDCGEMLTGVAGHFSATHKSPEGKWHGHTWYVKAWFRNKHRLDARVMQASLNTMLARYDHSELPEHLAWGEDIAREIATLVNCVEVEVSRPAEGIYAHWKWNNK
jgi:hypothetical protein